MLEIHRLVLSEDIRRVEAAIKKNRALLDARNNRGETPLHLACACRNFAIVKYLVDEGADLTIVNMSGGTPLNMAAYNLMLEKEIDGKVNLSGNVYFIVKLLIKKYRDQVDEEQFTTTLKHIVSVNPTIGTEINQIIHEVEAKHSIYQRKQAISHHAEQNLFVPAKIEPLVRPQQATIEQKTKAGSKTFSFADWLPSFVIRCIPGELFETTNSQKQEAVTHMKNL